MLFQKFITHLKVSPALEALLISVILFLIFCVQSAPLKKALAQISVWEAWIIVCGCFLIIVSIVFLILWRGFYLIKHGVKWKRWCGVVIVCSKIGSILLKITELNRLCARICGVLWIIALVASFFKEEKPS
ncbi:MAG: hypothetical protein LBD15_03590 [Holosporales bacterium]|nr:hypothetical protein [Holosporales bacterium]